MRWADMTPEDQAHEEAVARELLASIDWDLPCMHVGFRPEHGADYDPDQYERPGHDTHTNNLRGGYA